MTTTGSSSGNTATISWSFPSTKTVSGLTFSFNHVDANLGGVASNGRSGSGNETITAGYSTTVSYTVLAYYSRSGHSDSITSDSGSVTTGAAPFTPPSSAASAYDAGSGNVTVTWDFTAYSGYNATSSGISGGDGDTYGSGVSASSGSATYFVGYSSTVSWYVTDNFGGSYTGSVTTGAAPGGGGGGGGTPPDAPNPVTGLSAVLTGATSVALTWVAPSGGSSSVEVRRNGTAITTSTGTSYTDTSKPAGSVTYQVFAVNTNVYGVTYASGSNAVTVGGAADSCGILQS